VATVARFCTPDILTVCLRAHVLHLNQMPSPLISMINAQISVINIPIPTAPTFQLPAEV
jgi:hypothetical protein